MNEEATGRQLGTALWLLWTDRTVAVQRLSLLFLQRCVGGLTLVFTIAFGWLTLALAIV